MAQATHMLNIVIRVVDKATAPLKGVENNVKRVETATKRATTNMLGLGLGLTFFMFGVQIQLEKMMRSMFNIFKQAEGETGALNQQFNMMRAQLAAISIAFFDAFAQSALFDALLSFITSLANWFLNLQDAQRETVVEGIIKFFLWSKAIGFVGQLVLGLFIAFQVLKLGAFPILIVGAGLIFLWARGWDIVEIAIFGVGIGMLLLAKRLILLGGVFNLVASLWFIAFAGGLIVLALLIHKFGSFGNALKAWAAGIILAIALVVQGVLDIIILAINGVLSFLNILVEKYNRIARRVPGLSEISTFETKGRVDFTGGVASLLDRIGLNPQPVEAEPITLQSILGGAEQKISGIQEDSLKTQQEFTTKLSDQINLQEETLIEQQTQTLSMGDILLEGKKQTAIFEQSQTQTIGELLGDKKSTDG